MSPARMYVSALGLILVGALFITLGATGHDGPKIAMGIWLASMGLAYTLFHRVIRRQIRHHHNQVSRMKREYSDHAGND
jgi:hypothetical protein